MHCRKWVSAALVVSALAVAQKPAESQPAATTRPTLHNLRFSEKARPVLVDVSQTAKGKVAIKRGSIDVNQPIDYKMQARWLDELAALDDTLMEDRRTFIEMRVSEGGINKDPGLEGVTIVFINARAKESVRVEGPRQVLKTELQKQLKQTGATGLFVPFPAEAAIGDSFRMKTPALLVTMLSLEGELEDFESALTLERVDPKTNRAFVSGSAKVTEVADKGGVSMASKYVASLAMEFDMTTREMAEVVITGTATVVGRGDLAEGVSGEVKFDAKATTKPATDVAAIKNRKPAFRENTHRFAGLECRLPSCWLVLKAEAPEVRTFVDSRLLDQVIIEVARLSQEADPSTDDFVTGFADALKNDDPNSKVVKTTFPIGKGVMFDLAKEDDIVVRGAVVPFGKSLVRVRLYGKADLVKKGESDLKAVINSLKKSGS